MSTCNGVFYGNLQILYGKAEYYPDCSPLFVDKKIKIVDLNTYGNEEIMVATESIEIIRKRLDLMGYTLDSCKKQYQNTQRYGDFIPFEEFLHIICETNPLFDDPFTRIVGGLDPINFSYWHRILREYNRINHTSYHLDFDDDFFLHLDPLVKLRLFCEGHSGKKREVYWDIFETIAAGYYTEEEIFHDIDPKYKVTLITEGTSDMRIIERAVRYYFPEYVHFFEFVDYEKISVFGGADKSKVLFRAFVKLQIINRILFIFDNDVAGIDNYNAIKSEDHQNNLMMTLLPDLDCLKNAAVLGPEGKTNCDMNKHANTIECFLDFSQIDEEVTFRWKTYIESAKQYQGEIIQKGPLNKTIEKIGSKGYNHEKLDILINHLIHCICK